MSYNRNENIYDKEFEDKDQTKPHSSQNETNLYQQYQQNQRIGPQSGQQNQYREQSSQGSAQRSTQGSTQGIPAISPDDFLILRDCNRESFYYRCLPLSVGTCAVMYFIAKQRNTRPAIWHYMSGIFGGWFFGKLSYRRTCEDRLVRSKSTSPFVKAIRRRRGLYTEDLQSGNRMTFEGSPDMGWETESKSSNYSYGVHEFADDKDLPSQQRNDSEDSNPQFSTTYDDLRARNRAGLKV